MLNALVVREHVRLDDIVVVPPEAQAIEVGDVGLVAGQRHTVEELLSAMMVCSANDAAEALAIHVAGSEAAFVKMMNAKALRLGLANTRAADPHGLSGRERSTAEDLAVLGRHVMQDPVLRRIVSIRKLSLRIAPGKTVELKATDRLLGRYRGIGGVKTGFTYAAGYCFVSAARQGELELVGVVLGSRSDSGRFAETQRLLDWGFSHFRSHDLVSSDTTVGVVRVAEYSDKTIAVHPEKSVRMVLWDGGGRIVTQVTLAPWTTAPVRRGQRFGTLVVSRDGKTLTRVPLVADADVPAPSTWDRISTFTSRAWDRAVDQRLTPGRAWAILRTDWPSLAQVIRIP